MFCALTLLVLAFAKCGVGSKEEAILDTLLLIARNVLQFGRLAAVMRQYGLNFISVLVQVLTFGLCGVTDPVSRYSRDQNPLISVLPDEWVSWMLT